MHGAQGSGGGAVHFDSVRRASLAGTVTFLALAGHAAGQGTLPGVVGTAIAVILATSLTVAACSKRRSFVWLVAYLLAMQLLIHLVLVLAAPHGHGGGSASLLPTGPMALGHLVAASIAAVVLARGEDTLAAWTRLLSACLTWLVPDAATPPSGPVESIQSTPWARVTSDVGSNQHRRGPPLFSYA